MRPGDARGCALASCSAEPDHRLPLLPCLLTHQLRPMTSLPPMARARSGAASRGVAGEPGAALLPWDQPRFTGSTAPEQAEMLSACTGRRTRSTSAAGHRPVSQSLHSQGGSEACPAQSRGRIISHPLWLFGLFPPSRGNSGTGQKWSEKREREQGHGHIHG